uniref:Glycosyltransferase family 8 protein n=1 Tax=Strongyloides papillosus TaxID=174720 RepID=A0A0N5B4K1_STREA
MIIVIDNIYFHNFYKIYITTDNPVKDILYPHQIAIVMIVLNASEHNYEQAIETVKCYSWHYNYTFAILSLEKVSEFIYNCVYFDFFFLRHCIVANYAQKYKNQIKYIVFIDGDVGVVNPVHKLENYLPKDQKDILFYDRIFNSEIAAGSYIIRNTLLARSFLKFFADYEYKMPKTKDGRCMKIYNYAKGFDQNMLFVSCMRYILNLMDETPNDIDYHTYEGGKIKIVKKFSKKRWARDAWLTYYTFCDDELFHHSWKQKDIKINKNVFKGRFLANEKICKSSDFLKLWDYDESFKKNCKNINDSLKILADFAYLQYMKELLKSNIVEIED